MVPDSCQRPKQEHHWNQAVKTDFIASLQAFSEFDSRWEGLKMPSDLSLPQDMRLGARKVLTVFDPMTMARVFLRRQIILCLTIYKSNA